MQHGDSGLGMYSPPPPAKVLPLAAAAAGVGEVFYPLAAGTGTRLGAGVLSIQATTA